MKHLPMSHFLCSFAHGISLCICFRCFMGLSGLQGVLVFPKAKSSLHILVRNVHIVLENVHILVGNVHILVWFQSGIRQSSEVAYGNRQGWHTAILRGGIRQSSGMAYDNRQRWHTAIVGGGHFVSIVYRCRADSMCCFYAGGYAKNFPIEDVFWLIWSFCTYKETKSGCKLPLCRISFLNLQHIL